jgi:hypothetical protein
VWPPSPNLKFSLAASSACEWSCLTAIDLSNFERTEPKASLCAGMIAAATACI